MNLQRIAAFSRGNSGGNPAGVALTSAALNEADMARIAAEVGYSETAFAFPLNEEKTQWRVRYFSPESEVPFCGHATIALGAALTEEFGVNLYSLQLNKASIEVASRHNNDNVEIQLKSPPTSSRAISDAELNGSLALFNLTPADLSSALLPAWIHGGADHLVLPLKSQEVLSSMNYNLDEGRAFMQKYNLVTIMLVFAQDAQTFHSRNAFASGGVLEDPATGAASAAFAGYLRDCNWPHNGHITLYQGQDMGAPSVISVTLTNEPNSPVTLAGTTRRIE